MSVRFFGSEDGAGDVTSSHTTGGLRRPSSEPTLWQQWFSPTRFLFAAVIILGAVMILLPALLKARAPALEYRSIAQLESVGAAILMYVQDHDDYPLRANWHWAIRPYINNPGHPELEVEPGGPRDPLKCKEDSSDHPVSYLYLDRRILDDTMRRLGDSVTPLVVDEYYHRYAIMVWYDGHVTKEPKERWAYVRLRQWKIRRDLQDPASFSYERIPGTQPEPVIAPPYIAPTERYIWPEF